MLRLNSLAGRLALVVGLATIPLLLNSLLSYRAERAEAIADLKRSIGAMLRGGLAHEAGVVDNVHQVLRIMAVADDLVRLDAEACQGLARRLLSTQANFTNLGVVLPDGMVFCSGRPMTTAVSVADRGWFKEASARRGLTRGYYQQGRISGERAVTFGYPLFDADGRMRAALFGATRFDWVQRVAASTAMPPGWTALIVAQDGGVVARFPTAAAQPSPEAELVRLVRTRPAESVGELAADGDAPYLYGIAPLASTAGDLYLVVGAPSAAALKGIEGGFLRSLALVLLIAAASFALAWRSLRRNVVAWAEALAEAMRRFGSGALDARMGINSSIVELQALSDGFDRMGGRIERLTRAHALLSAIDREIVTPQSRGELFEHVCRIAVEQGGYQASWLGLTAGHQVEPVASAGDPALIDASPIDLDDPAQHAGPVAAAVLGGRVEYCNDLACDPRPLPRREARLAAGLQTVAAIPIAAGDTRIGALCLLSTEADLIDAEQLRLMAQIGDDIGHAVEVFEQREALARLNAELELRVAERTLALSEANRDLEGFTYSVSHDLRAPLRAVSGYADILAERVVDSIDPQSRHYLERLQAAAEQMSRLIDDLLRYSRCGREAVRSHPVPLAPLLERLLSLFAPRLAAVGGTIELAAELASPLGDERLVEQVLSNLIDNALKYQLPTRSPRVGISAVRDGGRVLVRVVDNGIGIEPEYHEKIFDPFQRLHSEEAYPGSGIGLALVLKAARLMGGEVRVESAPGAGSTFTLDLPAATEAT